MRLKKNNMKGVDNKTIRFLAFTLLSAVFFGAMFHGEIHATSGGIGSHDDTNPCPTGNCSGSGGGEYHHEPYWVYFRIKDDPPTNGSWSIAGEDVSACKDTEGLYFSFNTNNKTTDKVKNSQQTMPWSGFNWETGAFIKGPYDGYVPMTFTTQENVHEVDNVYDKKIFEPEYILTMGQTAPNGIVHQPISSSQNYTIGDLNKNGLPKYENGKLIVDEGDGYDGPSDAVLYILNRWDEHVRLVYFEGNNYYYNPKDKTHPYGKMCKLPDGSYSANACRIYAYDGEGAYINPKLNDGISRGNYSVGDNGKRWVVNEMYGDKYDWSRNLKYIGRTNIAWASRVNVVWFCSGTASGKFSGTSVGTINDTNTTLNKKDDSTNTWYYDGTRSDGTYTVDFTHTIERLPDDNTINNKRIKPVQEATIVTTVDGQVTGTEKWTRIRLDEGESTSKKLSVGDIKVDIGKTVTVCQTMTYQPVYEDGLPKGGTESSTACVVIAQAIVMTTGSRSYVDNSINSNVNDPAYWGQDKKTVESWAGSKTGNFTYSFYHQLKVEGVEGYTPEIEFYITQTRDGVAETVAGGGSQSAPNKTKANDVKSGKDKYYTVFTSTGSWGTIGEGGKTPEICQTIWFKPKKFSVKTLNGTATSDDNVWQSSTVCTLVKRRASTKITLSASSVVTVDGKKNPTSPVVSTKKVTVTFGFSINNNTDPKDRNLTTKYTIERLVYDASGSKDWSKATIAANNVSANLPLSSAITDSFNIERKLGKTITVCERIKLNPNTYRVDYKGNGTEDGVTANSGSAYFGERCASIAWPDIVMMDDGEISVSASSSATIKDTSQATYDTSIGMYVMKQQKGNQQDKQSATVTYTHTLSRGVERHAGGDKALVGNTEKVTIRYRLDDDKTTFTSTSIVNGSGDYSILPSVELKTNSTQTVTSNKNQNYMNKNTKVTVSNVATPKTVCQAINYISNKYTLRGSYYMLDGKIYSGDTKMIGVEPPVSKYTVGKSKAACVTVMRPYNFKVDQIPVISSPETFDGGEGNANVEFEIDVAKNDGASDFSITDIPDASIQVLKLTITEPLTDSDPTTGGTISGNPCSHFENALGAKAYCEVVRTETKTITPTGSNDSSNASYYDTDDYKSKYTIDETISGTNITIKICYAIAVNPKSSGSKGYGTSKGDFDTTKWVVSDAACINIGKRPTMQVWGGSVFSSGGIRTTTSKAKINGEATARTFGSWSDYMVVANGTNPNMASGATFISGMLNVTTCKYSPLTIANSKCETESKNLGNAHIVSANSLERGIYDYYIKNSNGKYLDLKTVALEGGSRVVSKDTLNKASGTHPIMIYDNDSGHQNLYIKEDISVGFAGRTYSNNDIPQVIIYTPGNVYISPQVTRIDAWIIAGGEVRTCADANGTVVRTQSGRTEECDKVLTITGPVYAKKVLFDRIAKSDINVSNPAMSTMTDPAELINLSPATYMFGYSESTNNAQPNVTYIHKLPVRY